MPDFYLICVFSYKERFYDSVLRRENMGQRNTVLFLGIFHSVISNKGGLFESNFFWGWDNDGEGSG